MGPARLAPARVLYPDRDHHDPRFDWEVEAYDFPDDDDDDDAVPVEVPAGSGVTMGRADHRDIVLVAETDPYAYKGTDDVMRPHVRPDGQGGCLR